MKLARVATTGIGLAFLIAACGGSGDDDGTGGNTSTGATGGTSGSAGKPGAGGASGSSGSPGTGGKGGSAGGAGGSTGGTGGSTGGVGGSTGGTPAVGGSAGTGVVAGSGGSSSGAAGTPSAGGSGGMPGSGGSSSGAAGTPSLGGMGGNLAGSGGNAPAGGMAGTATAGAGAGGGDGVVLLPLVTSAPNAYWKTDGTLTDATGNADVTVNDSMAKQTWEGFGGAFNELGWQYLSALTEANRNMVMQLLFGADGAHFSMGRIPMGSSDYAVDRYTYDETANDTSMAKFSIARDEQKLIPFINAAKAINPNIRFWGSPWTPPTWMKSSPYQSGNVVSAFDGGTMKSDASILTAHAQYFVKFVQAYKEKGINVEAVAPQNEPNFGQNYPSCLWATQTFVTFVGQYLGPAFKAANLTTKIMLGTMSNGDSGKDPSIVSAVLGDATAKSFISLVGMQWGMQGKVSSANGLPVWQTEHKCGNYPWMSGYKTTAPNDQAYGVESWGLIRDWIKDGVTAYSAWNMVLDPVGKGIDTTRDWAQNALIVVDPNSKKVTPTPTYYVFRHFSQFVQPGAKVVSTSGGDALAFKNPDGTLVAVMYNSGGAKTMTVALGSKKVSFSMPGSGWATVTGK
jgi:glucosylceramidase